MEEILVIGDAHNGPKQTNRRWRAMNKRLKSNRPDKLLIGGDWIDMASLSRFDTIGSKALEGARIEEDIESGVMALEIMLEDIQGLPIVFIEGNHEERLARMEEEHPKLMGMTSIENRFREAAGKNSFLYVPYKHYYTIAPGFLATHVPFNSLKPIESTLGARKILSLSAQSVIWFHTHQLDFATLTRNGAAQIYGLNAGCFIDPLHDPAYMYGRIKDWWRGLITLKIHPGKPWGGEFSTENFNSVLQMKGKK